MKRHRLTTVLTAGALVAILAACAGAEPEVQAPVASHSDAPGSDAERTSAESVSPSAEAAPTTAPTTEEPAPTAEEPTTEAAVPDGGLPTTVEDYAEAYLAAGVAGDEALLAELGTDDAVAQAASFHGLGWEWETPTVREGESGMVHVRFLGEGPNALTLDIDRATAEAGEADAVLGGELGDALPEWTPEEYADEVVSLWPQDDAVWTGVYVVPEVMEVLAAEPAEGQWDRTGSTHEGDLVLVTYVEAGSGRELVLTVDPTIVAERDYEAVVDVEVTD